MLYLILGLVTWFGCGFIAAGWEFAYFQGRYYGVAEAYKKLDSRMAWTTLFFGIIALGVNYSKNYNRYGWKKWW